MVTLCVIRLIDMVYYIVSLSALDDSVTRLGSVCEMGGDRTGDKKGPYGASASRFSKALPATGSAIIKSI